MCLSLRLQIFCMVRISREPTLFILRVDFTLKGQ